MEIIVKTIREIESLIKTGKTPPSKEERYYNGDINWYTPGDLDKEKFLGKSNRTITKEAVAENKATIIPKHTVVIGAIGDIGKLGITSIESCTNQQITGIRTNDEVYFEYLYYWLKANKQLLRNNAKNAILPILNNESIRSIKIQFPREIDDQKRIAKVLSQCESLIQKRKESIDSLDELLRSTFLEMFGDPIFNLEGYRTEILKKVTLKIGSGSTPRGGKESYFPTGISLIRSLNIHDNYFKRKDLAFIDSEQADKLSNVIVEQDDVLFNITGASVCRCAIVPYDILPARVNQHVSIIRPQKDELNHIYLCHLFLSENFKKYLLKIATQNGATREAITKEQLENVRIPIAPPELQENFSFIANKIEDLKRQNELSLIELQTLYESISQRALKGELDLSKVDISDMEDSKKKELKEVMKDLTEEQLEDLIDSFEHTLPTGEVPSNRETDIRDMSIRQYFGLLEKDEVTQDFEFTKMNKDYFYQFIITQGFPTGTFTLPDLEKYARKYILKGTGFEFTYDNWKTIIFRFIGAKQPMIEQLFDEETKTIKLKLTDEAFKV